VLIVGERQSVVGVAALRRKVDNARIRVEASKESWESKVIRYCYIRNPYVLDSIADRLLFKCHANIRLSIGVDVVMLLIDSISKFGE
jgi:hypothetical protein